MELSQKLQLKPLLAEGKHILKEVHDITGVDFEDERVTVAQVSLPKTVKAIVKEFDIKVDKTDNYILIQNRYDGIYRIVKFFAGGTIDIDIKTSYASYNKVRNYYRKVDFEQDRKRKELKCFVIISPKVQLDRGNSHCGTQIAKLKYDFTSVDCGNRYTNGNERACNMKSPVTGEYETYVTGAWNIRRQDTNRSLVFDIDYSHLPKGILTGSLEDIIDKSGYNVIKKRLELFQKTEQLKSERQKQRIIDTDYSKENEELGVSICQLFNKAVHSVEKQDVLSKEGSNKVWELNRLLEKITHIADSYRNHLVRLENVRTRQDSWYVYKTTKEVEDYFNSAKESIGKIEDTLHIVE